MSASAYTMPNLSSEPQSAVLTRDPMGAPSTAPSLSAASPAAAEPPAPVPNGIPRTYQFDRITRLGRGMAKPVFAVLHSNGAFFPVGHRIGAEHRFVALQAADRRSGGRLPPTIEEIAAGYVRQLLSDEPSGPYVLLGWCRAGNIAYEAAQQLLSAGHGVSGIVLVDTWNPAYCAEMSQLRRSLTERSYGIQVVLSDLAKVRRGELALRTALRQRRTLQRLFGPMPEALAATGPAADTYRADRAFDTELGHQLKQACDLYRPRPFTAPILHIRSSEEPCGHGLDRKFGWGALHQIRFVTLPGDHYTIFLEPTVDKLSQCILDALVTMAPNSLS